MRQLDCIVPIRVRITGTLNDEQSATLQDSIASAVEKRLQFARRTFEERMLTVPPPRYHAPTFQLPASMSSDDRSAMADLIKTAIASGITGRASNIPGIVLANYQAAKKPATPKPKQPVAWAVEGSLDFKILAADFINLMREFGAFAGVPWDVEYNKLYAQFLQQVRPATLLVVSVKQAVGVETLINQLNTQVAAKVPNYASYLYGYTTNQKFRQRLIDSEREGRVLMSLPDLSLNRVFVTLTGIPYLPAGSKLFFVLMMFPKMDLKESTFQFAELTVQLQLRDVDYLINPDSFRKLFHTEWADYLDEYGSTPVTFHIRRFNVVSPMHNDTLRYLINEEVLKLYNEDTAIFGRLELLNSAGIQNLPAPARALVQPLIEDPEMLKVPGVPADGMWKSGWQGAFVYVAIGPSEDQLNTARYSPEARANAARLIDWLNRDRAFPWSWNLLSWLSSNYQAHSFRAREPRALAFEFLLRTLEAREAGKWFKEFFDAVEASHNGDLIYFVMKMASQTAYASHQRIIEMTRRVNATRRKYLLHAYDVDAKEIWINHDPKKKLKVGDRASKVDPWFTLKREIQRIKAGRLEELQKAVAEEGKKLFGEILAGKDNTTYTEEKFTEKVLTEAAKKIKLSDKDLEDVTITRTLRLLDLQERVEDGVERYYITYEHLEREGDGDAEDGWVAVPGSKRTVSDGDFEFLLWAWVYNHEAAIVEAFAIGVSILAVIVIAWEVGAIAALIDLAGGALNVAISIGISELIYLCTAEHYTLKGFLLAALDGYLGAVGFRFGGIIGRSIAGQIGTATMRRVVVGWIAEKAITGIIGGATTGFLTTFANGLIDVATGQGGFPTFGDFVRNMALGAAMGVVFEFAGGALQPLAKVVGRTGLDTLASMAKMIREEGISITRFTASAETALANIRQWARTFMEDVHAKGVGDAFEQRIAQVTEAMRDLRQAALFRRVLELNNIEINRASNAALDKLLGATEGHMTDQNLLGLFNRLAKAGRLGRFMEMMNLLDEEFVNSLALGNRLEAFADAIHLQDLIALRGSEIGARFLNGVFRGSVTDAEGFLTRIGRHGNELRARAVDILLRPNQRISPQALETVANRTGAISQESLGALDRLYASASRDAADDFLARTTQADFPRLMRFLASLSRDFAGVSGAPLGEEGLGGIDKLLTLASAHLDEVARILNRTRADAGRLRQFLNTIHALSDDAVTRLSGGPELGHLADAAHLLQLAESRSAGVMWNVVSDGFGGSVTNAEAWMTRLAPQSAAVRTHAVDLLIAPGRVYTPEGIFQVVSKAGVVSNDYAAALNRLYTAQGAANADALLTAATPNQLSLNATTAVIPAAAADLATIEANLVGIGRLNEIQIINEAGQLQAAHRIANIEDWAHSTAPNAPAQLPDYVTELAAARNLANTAPPGSVVRVGQDALTAGRSFDVTQETAAGGAVERRMEMYTPGTPIRGAGDLDGGAAHAIGKIPAAVRAGTVPRPAGTYEAGIRLQTWPPPPVVGGATERVYAPNGDWELRDTATGTVRRTGNLADDFARNLNFPHRIADSRLLDMVTVYDSQGNVLFRVRNRTPGTGNDWVVAP